MSYQREDERYWTDYLRVALPIVGLLLLVGLLWFWLASIIGDDGNDEPTVTPNVGTTVIAAATQTATQTPLVEITPTTGPGPTNTPGGDQQPTNTPAEGEPTDAPATEGYQVGDTVITNTTDVNIRSSPTTQEENVVDQVIEQGSELTITGPSEEGDDRVWWPVENPETGITGYVADELIDPSE